MTLNDIADSIYVINLKDRVDRKEHIMNQLKKIKCVNYILFEGVNGKKIKNPTRLPSGMFGLINTYFNMYEDWKKHPKDNILIIEDDCVFVDGFNEKLNDYIKHVPEDWDMLYFGGNHNTHVGSEPPTIINDKVCKLHNTFSTHCVAINNKAFKEVLERLKKCDNALDVIYSELQKKLNVYSFYPMIATQRVSFSDIENKMTDYKWLIK